MLPHERERGNNGRSIAERSVDEAVEMEAVMVKEKFVIIKMISLVIGCMLLSGCTNALASATKAPTDEEPVTLEDAAETFLPKEDDARGGENVKEIAPFVAELSEHGEKTLEETSDPAGNEESHEEGREETGEEAGKALEQPSAVLPETEEPEASPEGEEGEGVIPTDDREMYAQREVNLREGPGTEYQTCGRLRRGDAVTVCGTTRDGWYLLRTGQFVFGRYLGEEPPVMESVIPSQDMPESSDGVGEGVEPEEYVASADEFLNKVNEQRTALGLSALIRDDAMTEYAKKRAREIAACFSHDGFSGYSGENIGNFSSGDAGTWFATFYKSQGHRENMMDPSYERTGAAVYFNGREFFVVQVFQHRAVGQDALGQASDGAQGGDLLPAGQSDGGMTQGYSTTGEAVSPGDDGYDELSAAAQALLDEWNAQNGNQ